MALSDHQKVVSAAQIMVEKFVCMTYNMLNKAVGR